MEKEKVKIQIKNRFTGNVLFEYEREENTMKDTVVEAVKKGADLRGADLRGADLYGANLCGANLGSANLRCANLRGANLRGANLCGANLGSANLRCANLRGADLGDAKNIPFIPMTCPSDGAFIGWKKVKEEDEDGHDVSYLVKLLIPEGARRCSATRTKCRCDYAQVLGIYNIDKDMAEVNSVTGSSYTPTTYKVGENVYPDSFDENRWNECSHGIHFFINKQEAIDY